MLSAAKTTEALKLLNADVSKAPEERAYQGEGGPEALRKALGVGSRQSVWRQLHDMTLESGELVEDALAWGRAPRLSAAKTTEALKLLNADVSKAPEERAYQGEGGPEAL